MDRISEKQFVLEDYTKEKCIGRGGYGTLYVCSHKFYKKCVLKEIPLITAPDVDVAALDKEARILSSLKHPNIIKYYDHKIVNKVLYIAMEHAPGGDLSKYIASKGRLEKAEVVDILSQVVCGLAYLHFCEVIHRDLCARNVVRTAVGSVKLVDFGMSKMIESISVSSGGPVGTPGNFAPELCYGGKASTASDIWALGCLLYHLCTGRPPFSSPSLAGTVRLILSSERPPKLPKEYGPDLEDLLGDLMDRTPTCRPSAGELMSRKCLAVAVHTQVPRIRTRDPRLVLEELGYGHLL